MSPTDTNVKPVEADITLLRVSREPAGCFGVLLQDSIPFACTVERTYPLAGNVQLVKIPAGTYTCKKTIFHKKGYQTYEITGVAGHSRLLFHRGNVEDDSEGCVLVGQGFGLVSGRDGILYSTAGFHEFMRRAADRDSFTLVISEREGIDRAS